MKKSHWNSNNISDQSGKTIIITGATSGLGKEAIRQLAPKNATLIMAVRNLEKAEQVKQEIQEQYPNADLRPKHLDLGSLTSIKAFAKSIEAEHEQLDLLINNAGVMMCPYSKTEDGFEIQMGTNHFGPYALTGLLMPLLKKSKGSRVVSTSSIAHSNGNINFSDIHWENRNYKTMQAYGDSKLANLYFTYALAQRLENDPTAPIVTAAHPGWTSTDLQRHSGVFRLLNPIFSQGVEMGVLPTLRAAFDPEAQSGDYYGPSRFFEMHGSPKKVSSNKLSRDQESAKNLWNVSEELTGVRY